ncbi:membrane-bound PQQ-dependent dehydrogenase, glucose/quinate/shikimate family [Salinisphaera sp.]|uniref:membrane-bound PQQ-dependent dehydrogenase, glucose/quinate/shikimate family n=1 Tax=Salinisphaera sp. TaxID=1914330 RepID=UPI002D78B119|nr:membrane-bound PQQ-dependent dehydrogenase, glucose/quinate/shikimate family [Salinisphaera sp.]HET7314550.1 membrane-bound PQQ-dependent dehydrogenase, glucose/quinate/shikimate family [Salinisphaera sp.]
MSRSSKLTIVVGVIVAILGLGLAVEGGWLTAVGGTPAYMIAGLGYLAAGILIVARRSVGFWLSLLIFAAAIVWSFWETGFNQMTVFTALPRLDVPMVIALLMMIPWVWRGIAGAALPALVSGAVSLALLGAGIGVMVSMPWVNYPNGKQLALHRRGPHVTLPKAALANPDDWPSWARTPGQSRYAPLKQINVQNVSQLKKVWSYQSGDMHHAYDESPHWGSEATPIKVNDTLYTCTPNAWVIALDPATGKQKWKFKDKQVDDDKTNFVNCRGVSYYKAPKNYTGPNGGDFCKTRIIAPTMGPYVVALDANTGKLCKRFGHNGFIDLKQNIGRMASGTLVQTSAPLVMDGLIYTGGNVYDNWYWGEPSGVVRAWDAVTGKEVWHWDLGKKNPTAPLKPGEHYTKATPNVWGRITGDPANDMIYIPTGNATPDYYAKERPAYSMEYSGSVVALNARTGHEKWHFQEAHTDIWDFDLPVGPTLVNWPDGHGGHIPALVSTTKQGEIFVLNRKTGKPIMPVKELPAPTGPKGSVYDGDWLSDTQPHSVAEPQLVSEKLSAKDMWGATPFDQMWCRVRFNELYYKGYATPPTVQGSLMYPTFDGATDWYGASYSPNGTMNIVNNHLPFVGTLIPRKHAHHPPAIKNWNGKWPPPRGFGGGPFKPMYGLPYAIHLHPFLSPIQMPCNQPPWAKLMQVDLASGKVLWSTPLGNSRHTAPFGYKQFIPLPTSVPELGSGIMTAGGVTFIAGTADDMLRAYNTQTGEVLWSTYLPAGGQANPAIYKANGREYVVITAGGHQPLGTIRGDYTIAFALPKSAIGDKNGG